MEIANGNREIAKQGRTRRSDSVQTEQNLMKTQTKLLALSVLLSAAAVRADVITD
jgi:hypothetical protein